MADIEKNMVLRTVYLPQEVDLALKNLAFTMSISKGELIRLIVDTGLTVLRDMGVRSLAELRTDERFKPGLGLDVGEILGREDALGKLKQALSSERTVKAALTTSKQAKPSDQEVEDWLQEHGLDHRKSFGM